MRRLLSSLFLLLSFSVLAGPPSSEQDALLLSRQAQQETDPQKSRALLERACSAWQMAFSDLSVPDYLFKAGTCFFRLGDLDRSERALRSYLLLVSSGSLADLARELLARILASAPPPPASLVLDAPLPVSLPAGPLVVEDSPAQQKKRLGLVLGGVLGAGALSTVALFVVRGFLREPSELNPIPETVLR